MYILKDNYLLMFFLLHLSLAVIALFISIKGSKGVDKLGLIIVSASYVLIVFARPGLGVDETTYRVAYETYLSNPNMVEFEYSFKTLFYFFKIAEVTPEVFNNTMCCLYIMLMTILVLFTVQSSFKTLCLLIFLFSAVSLDFIFNAYRQGFAFIFVFASLIFYKGNKRLLSALFIIIAIGFHWSSIFIPMLMFCFR
ncbi:EpsG family protein, partial [Enterobacter sichuanensis]|uniref:EpsG family protein n=1 Tax=Enterobacter sichuanensis TaxID=2071710 RepID=UPI001AAFC2D8